MIAKSFFEQLEKQAENVQQCLLLVQMQKWHDWPAGHLKESSHLTSFSKNGKYSSKMIKQAGFWYECTKWCKDDMIDWVVFTPNKFFKQSEIFFTNC